VDANVKPPIVQQPKNENTNDSLTTVSLNIKSFLIKFNRT